MNDFKRMPNVNATVLCSFVWHLASVILWRNEKQNGDVWSCRDEEDERKLSGYGFGVYCRLFWIYFYLDEKRIAIKTEKFRGSQKINATNESMKFNTESPVEILLIIHLRDH